MSEYYEDFRAGVSEAIDEAIPGLTKKANAIVTESIIEAIISDEGMDKEASRIGAVTSTLRQGAKATKDAAGNTLASRVGDNAIKALTNIGIAALAGGTIHNMIKSHRNREMLNQYADFTGTLASVASKNEILANENQDRIRQLGDSIFKFAPHVASDPMVLETVMTNAIQGMGGLDPNTVRSLQEMEEKYQRIYDTPSVKNYLA